MPPDRGPLAVLDVLGFGSVALLLPSVFSAEFLELVFLLLVILGLLSGSAFLLLFGGDSPVFSGDTFLFPLFRGLLPNFLGLFLSLFARVGCTDFGDLALLSLHGSGIS